MSVSLTYPRQCLWIEQGLVTHFVTVNSGLLKNFEETNLLTIEDDGEVLRHLALDLIQSSPTPGFRLTVRGKLFGQETSMTFGFKLDQLFGAPRTNIGLLDHIGIEGTAWNDVSRDTPPLQLKAYIRLGTYRRWSIGRCFLLGDESKNEDR